MAVESDQISSITKKSVITLPPIKSKVLVPVRQEILDLPQPNPMFESKEFHRDDKERKMMQLQTNLAQQ